MALDSISGLEGKVVVYTGAAGLIGTAAVKLLVNCGANVVAVDPNFQKLAKMKQDFESDSNNGSIEPITDLNCLDASLVSEFFEKVYEKYGRIDCLINSAYPRTKDWGTKFETIPFESWQQNVDQHLNSYFLMCQQVSLIFKKIGSGNIINFSSIYGLVGPDFSVYGSSEMTMPAAYSAIKGGISNLTRYLASYLGPSGIRVNAICPGGVFDNQNESFVANYSAKTPMRRMASVDDVVKALIFLVSDLSTYVSGVNLPVDGGWSAI